MKRLIRALCVAALLSSLVPSLAAQNRKVQIKIASIVPTGTPWQEYVDRMAAEWMRLSNGKVQMVVYHGSQLGKVESQIITQMKLNQIQGAILTSIGLGQISPEAMSLCYPFLIRNESELDTVLNEMKPELESSITKAGYRILAWSKVGWVKFFSKTPVYTPADLRKMKLASSDDLAGLNNVLRNLGFNLVNTSIDDTLIAVNSGAVDATYQSPIAIASAQIFGVAPNMTDLGLAPFMGGIVLNQRAWRQIEQVLTDSEMSAVMAATARIETELNAAVQKLEADAVEQMKGYGLKEIKLTPVQTQEWYNLVDANAAALENNTTFDSTTIRRISETLQRIR
jgi:TRAP-type C4-dicarboxylate transport system substrate-binding protein